MGRARRLGAVVVAVLVILDLVVALRTEAVPRYSARYDQHCALCHVNPTGGGLRTTYASQQIVPQELALSSTRPDTAFGFDPRIGRNLIVGTDYREMYIYSEVKSERLGFFQMQSDLYFDFELHPAVSLYYDRGAANSYELFGLGYLTPRYFVKAGRFVPSYGWRFDDHTMFVRDDGGFAPPANSDVGVELGTSIGRLDAQLGVVNGNRGSIQDNDGDVSLIANGMVRGHLGPVGAAGGVSGYHDPRVTETFDSASLYGYLTWKNVTWLGQGDLFRHQPDAGGSVSGVVSSNELSVLVRQGVEVKGTYDFYDPDRHHETGAKHRWGGSVFVMPQSFVTLEGFVRQTTFENGIVFTGRDYLEVALQLHLLY